MILLNYRKGKGKRDREERSAENGKTESGRRKQQDGNGGEPASILTRPPTHTDSFPLGFLNSGGDDCAPFVEETPDVLSALKFVTDII